MVQNLPFKISVFQMNLQSGIPSLKKQGRDTFTFIIIFVEGRLAHVKELGTIKGITPSFVKSSRLVKEWPAYEAAAKR